VFLCKLTPFPVLVLRIWGLRALYKYDKKNNIATFLVVAASLLEACFLMVLNFRETTS
jgi:hypothetical protein